MMRKLYLLVPLILFLAGCGSSDRLHPDVTAVKIDPVKIRRYDLDLFRIPLNELKPGLEALKPQYRFFLEANLEDTAKLNQMAAYLINPRNIEFYTEVKKQFGDASSLETKLTEAFRHFRFYFPDERLPRVYAYISGGDYDYPVQYIDSVMLIAPDMYLGKDFKSYTSDGIPLYQLERMTRDKILPDCIKAMCNAYFPPANDVTNLLGMMVDAGKRLWFVDALAPDLPDSLKISYTSKQYAWIRENEQHVWAAMVENNMLFSTDPKIAKIFMSDGPFTPEFSKDSPPRLGEWIGWQIVKRYMEQNTDVTLQQMMREKDAQKLLTLSKYKPGK